VSVRPLLIFAIVAATFWLVLVTAAWAGQRALIYLPSEPPGAPAQAGLEIAEEVRIVTADGLTLDAWFVPAAGNDGPKGSAGGQGQGGQSGAVLMLPGNAGNRSHRAPLAAALADAGFAVLLLDYRGYGGNPGVPSEQGLRTDARAAQAFLASRTDVDPGRIAYYGESLGAAVAADLAADRPPAALVLRSPFPSLAEVGRLHYPYLPVRTLLRDRFPTSERVAKVDAPVLVVAGSTDRIVPPAMSRAVAEAANAPARFLLIAGAHHNDPALLAGEQLVGELTAFLRRTLQG
jgi:fermentation-respiration switch protein FrsA (DUF1100 family)